MEINENIMQSVDNVSPLTETMVYPMAAQVSKRLYRRYHDTFIRCRLMPFGLVVRDGWLKWKSGAEIGLTGSDEVKHFTLPMAGTTHYGVRFDLAQQVWIEMNGWR